MIHRIFKIITYSLLITIIFVLVSPAYSGSADGGMVVPEKKVWDSLKENQQTAVVTLYQNDTADIDLFVSMTDESGISHEVIFFVPLGEKPSNFGVEELTSESFQKDYTKKYDVYLQQVMNHNSETILALGAGSGFISGLWMIPAISHFLLSERSGWRNMMAEGGYEDINPVATYETENSLIELYDLDDNMNLELLTGTTGLDPAVTETLSRLHGQQIAIVKLRTFPDIRQERDDYEISSRSIIPPGLHLSWHTALTKESGLFHYNYPLGTGSAWAHPIPVTKVYVIAPENMIVNIEYPKLGKNKSGMDFNYFEQPSPRIIDFTDIPAYAIDSTFADDHYIWRATYSQSNAEEDITITVKGSGGFSAWIRKAFPFRIPVTATLILGSILSLLIWIVGWRYLMPRILKIKYSWNSRDFWQEALLYSAINAVLVLMTGFVIWLSTVITEVPFWDMILFPIGGIFLPIVILCIPIIWFVEKHYTQDGYPRIRLAGFYIFFVVIADCAYAVLATGIAALQGIL